MEPIEAFYPEVSLYAPYCPTITIANAVRNAAIEYCERTRFWRFDDEFNVTASDCEGLMAPQDAVVHEIDGVWFDGQKLRPVTPVKLDELLPNWRSGYDRPTGTPGYVTQLLPNTVSLVPYGTGRVKLSLILKPAQDAEQVPDFLVNQQRETVTFGALARILTIPAQSFTNYDLAAYFSNMFKQKIDASSTLGSSGQQRAAVRTRASFL